MRRLLLLALLACLLAPAAAAASPNQVMTFEAPRELLDDAVRDRTLDEIKALGVDRIRQLVYWRDFAPDPRSRTRPGFDAADPAAYPAGTWDRLDHLLDAASARGIEVMLTLTGPVPRWATERRRDQRTNPVPREFRRWVRAVALHVAGRVSTWSVWNEPNQPQFLLPQYKRGKPVSPKRYRRLYLAAVAALRGVPGGEDDTILLGETSPVGNARIVKPLTFLRGTLCLDARWRKRKGCRRVDADGYAHHAYTKRVGPTYKPKDRDEVTIGVLPRLVRALDRAGKAGAVDRRLGVWLTEFGIQSTPDEVAGVPLRRQAEYLAIAERIAYANPRVVAFSQYLLTDDAARTGGPPAERYSGFETGLRLHDGREKPAYRGFMLPLAVSRYGASDVLWGRVRPARAATEVTIERMRRNGDWERLTALTTNPAGVFGLRTRHRKGQTYRIAWVGPDGTTHHGARIRPY